MAEPECCGTPMVHNSFLGTYECADAYFALVDDEVFVDGWVGIDPSGLTDEQRTQYEHWRASWVADGWEVQW
jgi:hypothetical protein